MNANQFNSQVKDVIRKVDSQQINPGEVIANLETAFRKKKQSGIIVPEILSPNVTA